MYHKALCFAALIVAALGVGGPASAAQLTGRARTAALMTAWYILNANCRGGSGDAAQTDKACKDRLSLDGKLKKAGCTYRADDKWACRAATPICVYSASDDRTTCH
jgi:hypothetical protein